MRTELVPSSETAIARAAELLRAGEVVAFPTETVYGLGARADRAAAVQRIYAAKGRPENKPLIVHLPDAEAAPAWVRHWPPQAQALAERFWPGPLTLVLERAESVIDEVTGGGPSVAMRVPAHDTALRLLAVCGFALAAPSANRYGQPPPRSAEQVVRALGGAIPLVIDAGEPPLPASGRPAVSTIVDLTRQPPVLLRRGALPVAAVSRVIGQPVQVPARR